jgi:hypothetical protein
MQLHVKEQHSTAATLLALSKRDTMFNATTLGTHTLLDKRFWLFAVLSNLDTWCGDTCHTVLRYVLRSLLILVLVGTFAMVLVRTLDPDRRAQLKTQYGLAGETALLGRSKAGFDAGRFGEANTVVNAGEGRLEMNGPDVKDYCTVM